MNICYPLLIICYPLLNICYFLLNRSCTLRGQLEVVFPADGGISIEEVEPAANIVKRFATGPSLRERPISIWVNFTQSCKHSIASWYSCWHEIFWGVTLSKLVRMRPCQLILPIKNHREKYKFWAGKLPIYKVIFKRKKCLFCGSGFIEIRFFGG